jgi:hypothetical protein
VVHREEREAVKSTVEEAVQSGKEEVHRIPIVCPAEKYAGSLLVAVVILEDSENSDRLMGVSIDITERKQPRRLS